MSLLNILQTPWAITPDKFAQIQEVINRHLSGDKLDVLELKKHDYGDKKKARLPFDSIDGVAIIPIDGVISKKMNLLHETSGGVSTQLLGRDFRAAVDDLRIKGIILSIDSPGGTVDGTFEFANIIFEARGKKPIVSFSDGVMASAAYLFAAATDRVFISGRTVQVGSIGVVSTHIDKSEAEKKAGIKITEIVAGKYKRMTSEHEPLTAEGRKVIEEMVDDVLSVFVSDISKFRGVSEENVVQNMANGRMFMGQKAIKAGLVDGIMTFDELVSKMAAGESPGFQITVNKEVEAMDITKAFISEKHPEIAAALKAEGFDAGLIKGKHDGFNEGKEAASSEASSSGFKDSEEYKALMGKNTEMEKTMEGLKSICKDQSKELAIIKETSQEALAKSLAHSVLKASSIPSDLHEKVSSMVDYRKYIKEGESFEPGSASAQGYTEAVASEVKDWEARLGKSHGIGLESGKDDFTDISASEKEDAEYAKGLARSISGGAIRSDE